MTVSYNVGTSKTDNGSKTNITSLLTTYTTPNSEAIWVQVDFSTALSNSVYSVGYQINGGPIVTMDKPAIVPGLNSGTTTGETCLICPNTTVTEFDVIIWETGGTTSPINGVTPITETLDPDTKCPV